MVRNIFITVMAIAILTLMPVAAKAGITTENVTTGISYEECRKRVDLMTSRMEAKEVYGEGRVRTVADTSGIYSRRVQGDTFDLMMTCSADDLAFVLQKITPASGTPAEKEKGKSDD